MKVVQTYACANCALVFSPKRERSGRPAPKYCTVACCSASKGPRVTRTYKGGKRRVEKHGHGRPGHWTSTFMIWRAMKYRCEKPYTRNYSDYGGRGIAVCERWSNSYLNFLADMGERPEGLSIDRIDNDCGYSPANCRWATREDQARNKRTSVLTYDLVDEIRGRHEHGEKGRWIADRLGVSRAAVYNCLNRRTWKDVP